MNIKIKSEHNSKTFEEIKIHEYFIEDFDLDNDRDRTVYQKITDNEYRNVFYNTGIYKNHKHSFPNRELHQVVFGDIEVKIVN